MLALVMAHWCTGCYTMNFYSDADLLKEQADGKIGHVSTVFATVEMDGPASLREVCPSGVSRVTLQQTFTDGLLHYGLAGFYSPQSAKVWCKRRKL